MAILETKRINKKFEGVHAVNNLSIKIESGKITGVIGPNGSGKTTLINLLSGTVPIDHGSVLINNTKLTKIIPCELPAYGITRTFQDVKLFEQITVLDNILVVLTEKTVLKSLFEKHGQYHLKVAETILEKVGLWEKRNELAVNLSYGQRKLLEIARALSAKSSIFLFDEPFAGLFPKMAETVTAILGELREQGKAILLIEHNMTLIRELSDHVIVMDEGKLLAEGPPEKVLEQEKVIEAYLGE